ncbi:GGDEF domain-containing protein [Geobacter sulfurreducens]|uniref:GGDEF domain-containing protein n=1 Tax=Geobacter sulfurreducens TaxID=35554 RepID=UPI000DBB25AD|nr:diguanylate cyclase [Geobacter sulfurreducens]BBA70755.1 putative diguanylate cyclase YdaM [Geobacter sulfurreducens]
MRILIADDDVTSRTMLTGLMKRWGYDVVEAIDGAQAWEELQKSDAPKLAVLDWVMPVMDGVEVIRLVRARSAEHLPYILLLTAKNGTDDVIRGLDAGADDYVGKPFSLGELRARIQVGRRTVELHSRLQETQEALNHQATHDPLTGVMNRRAIIDHLEKELSRVKRDGGRLSIGIVDIDHFKRVNDRYGHQTGDEVLCGCVGVLGGLLRDYDLLGRLGGEEFLVVAPGTGDDCSHLYERLRAAIASTKFTSRVKPVSVTISIGVAVSDGTTGLDDLLAAADGALYRAKRSGRDRVVQAESS